MSLLPSSSARPTYEVIPLRVFSAMTTLRIGSKCSFTNGKLRFFADSRLALTKNPLQRGNRMFVLPVWGML